MSPLGLVAGAGDGGGGAGDGTGEVRFAVDTWQQQRQQQMGGEEQERLHVLLAQDPRLLDIQRSQSLSQMQYQGRLLV